MKNYLLIAFIICATSLSAQSDGPGQVVKANPFGFIVGQYQFGYERALNEKFSVQMSAGLLVGEGSAIDSLTMETSTAKRSGFIVIPEFRFYPSGNVCEGFYIAAIARYRTATMSLNGDDLYTKNVMGGAAVLGYQLSLDAMMIDVFLGPQFKNVDTEWFNESFSEEEPLFGGGNGIRFGANIGFGW
tara:strand:- start:94 stop:654 length:561 start_codon:yes stop_codon:yes gene_type:complete